MTSLRRRAKFGIHLYQTASPKAYVAAEGRFKPENWSTIRTNIDLHLFYPQIITTGVQIKGRGHQIKTTRVQNKTMVQVKIVELHFKIIEIQIKIKGN